MLVGWMASQTRWTWVWVNSRSWRWTGRPGVLWFMGSQRVRHDWVTNTFTFASNACCPFCYLNSIYFSKFTSSPTFLMKHSSITLLFISSFPHYVLFHTTFTFFLPCMLVSSLQLYLHSLKVRTISTISRHFPKMPSPSSKEWYALISLINLYNRILCLLLSV
jgi:hypothetical protein